MDQTNDVPGWNGNTRDDQMRVVARIDDAWVVVPPDDRAVIDVCWCCDKPFATARNAKLMANAVYPPAGQPAHPLADLLRPRKH